MFTQPTEHDMVKAVEELYGAKIPYTAHIDSFGSGSYMNENPFYDVLFKHGADCDLIDGHGKTAFEYALLKRHTNLINFEKLYPKDATILRPRIQTSDS